MATREGETEKVCLDHGPSEQESLFCATLWGGLAAQLVTGPFWERATNSTPDTVSLCSKVRNKCIVIPGFLGPGELLGSTLGWPWLIPLEGVHR